MHLAVVRESEETVRFLIGKGLSVNAFDKARSARGAAGTPL